MRRALEFVAADESGQIATVRSLPTGGLLTLGAMSAPGILARLCFWLSRNNLFSSLGKQNPYLLDIEIRPVTRKRHLEVAQDVGHQLTSGVPFVPILAFQEKSPLFTGEIVRSANSGGLR